MPPGGFQKEGESLKEYDYWIGKIKEMREGKASQASPRLLSPNIVT
jgi:hypothetical protein